MAIAAIVALPALASSSSDWNRPKPLDWDRYHMRQDACTLYNERLWECSKSLNCSQTELKALKRQCSPFALNGQ